MLRSIDDINTSIVVKCCVFVRLIVDVIEVELVWVHVCEKFLIVCTNEELLRELKLR